MNRRKHDPESVPHSQADVADAQRRSTGSDIADTSIQDELVVDVGDERFVAGSVPVVGTGARPSAVRQA